MQDFIEYVTSLFTNDDIIINNVVIPAFAVKFLVLAVFALLTHLVASRLVLPILEGITQKPKRL